MAKLRRPRGGVDGAPSSARTFFVTSSTWERRQLFRHERMARLLLDVLWFYRHRCPYQLHEFTVMPEHFHIMISLDSGTSVERAVQFIKGGFSHRASRELGFKGEVWQRGFADHLVRDTRDFAVHREYILSNAVKRGLAERPEGYPYCSAQAGLPLDAVPERFGG